MTAPRLDLTGYPETVAEILRELPLAALGPGKPVLGMRDRLARVDESAFGTKDRDLARACRAGLWLAFDFLDESHQISQSLETAEGSYWHAIMHRREPDAANSKYWWRRVGDHPVILLLREQAPDLGYHYTDPFAFIDFVEGVRGTESKDEEAAKLVQKLEWELLFDHCYRAAI